MDPANFPLLDEKSVFSPDNLLSFLRKRRTVRHFTEKQVDRETLLKLADAGRYAPTGKNAQNFGFIFVTEREKIRYLSGMTLKAFDRTLRRFRNPLFRMAVVLKEGKPLVEGAKKLIPAFEKAAERFSKGEDPIFYDAPVLCLIHAPSGLGTPKDNCVYAMYNIVLMAETMGIGSCINGYFVAAAGRDRTIAEYLGIPSGHVIHSSAVLGYSDEKFLKAVDRKPANIKWI